MAEPDQVAAWENLVLPVIRGATICDYDVDNLKWISKSIMNSISLDLWAFIEKYLGIRSNIHANYTAIISNIQQISFSEICNLVDDLSKMSLIKEPGEDVETFGSQFI